MGAELAQSRFVVLLMSLPGAFFVNKNTICHFSDVPAGCKLEGFAGVKNDRIWMVLFLKSMLELLVLKKYAECTSRHVKRTSGTRVAILYLTDLSYL